MLQPKSLTTGTLSIWINLTRFLTCSVLISTVKQLKKCDDSGSTAEQGTSFAAEGNMQSRQCTGLQVILQLVFLGTEERGPTWTHTECSPV